MFGTDVEDCLPLVVAEVEEVIAAVEVLDEVFLDHRHIVVLQGVVEGQVAVVVDYVGPWPDFINDGVLHVNAHDMLNSLSFEILVASGSEEFVVAHEPAEDLLVAIPGTLKQRVLAEVVLQFESLKLFLFKDLEHLKVLTLSGDEDRSLSLEVGIQTAFRLHVVKSLDKLVVSGSDGDVQRNIAFNRILTVDVEVGEVTRHHQVVDYLVLVVLDGHEERSFAVAIPLL